MGKENPRIEVGTVINSWTVLHFVKKMSQATRSSGYMCMCTCGTIKKVNGYTLLSGISKSCGCERRKDFVSQGTKPIYYSIIYTIYRNYQAQAAQRNYLFSLTLDEFKDLIGQNCHYCGEPPSNNFKSGKRAYHGLGTFKYNGIDRMVNSEGYSITNCVPCCQKCNFAKKDFDYEVWVDWIYRVYHNLKSLGKFNDYPKGVDHKPMVIEMGSTREGKDIV